MEDFIDAEDMLDMLFEKKVNVLTYLPTDLLRNIVSLLSEAKDFLAITFVCTRLHAVMQEDFTWKKICLAQDFAFVHDEKQWKSYFFMCNSLRTHIRKIEYHTVKANRQLYGANEKWLVQCVSMEEGGTCLEAVSQDVATPLQDPNYVGRVLYYVLSKDTLVVGDRRNISFIDLNDGTIYDQIPTILNIEIIAYEPHSKQLFAGMDDGVIKCFRSSRARVTVGNSDPRYHTVDRPCITMKGHSETISALHVSVDCTDANQRLVSGAVDGSMVIWQKVYENGHSYRKEHVLAGHSGPVTKLFSRQNMLISSDSLTIQVWDQLSGAVLYFFTIIDQSPAETLNTSSDENKLDSSAEDQKINTSAEGINTSAEQKEAKAQDTRTVVKRMQHVSESCGRVVAVSGNDVFVWNTKTGDLSSSFSIGLESSVAITGVLLSGCYLFMMTSELHVLAWNIVNGEQTMKWIINRELMPHFYSPLAKYKLQLVGSGPTSLLVISTDNDVDSFYIELRATPPRFTGFRKRKREQLRN